MTYSPFKSIGTTAERPTGGGRSPNPEIGYEFFDTDLGLPIFWDGALWVTADGTDVGTLQTITVAYQANPLEVSANEAGNGSIGIVVTTSDNQITEREAHVYVNTLLTGTAVPGVHFTPGPPQLVVIPAGTADQAVISTAEIDYIVDAPGLPKTIDIEMADSMGAAIDGAEGVVDLTYGFAFVTDAGKLPPGTMGQPFERLIETADGEAPVVMTLLSGTLPAGAVFVDDGDGTCRITTDIADGGTGQLDEDGDFDDIVVQAEDDSGYIIQRTFEINVQSVIVEFTGPTDTVDTDAPGPSNAQIVKITTSDGGTLVTEVQVDVIDDGTGSAVDPVDYTVQSPQTLTFVAGTANNGTQPVQTTYVSPTVAPPVTIDRSLASPVAATLGAQDTHITTLDTVP